MPYFEVIKRSYWRLTSALHAKMPSKHQVEPDILRAHSRGTSDGGPHDYFALHALITSWRLSGRRLLHHGAGRDQPNAVQHGPRNDALLFRGLPPNFRLPSHR